MPRTLLRPQDDNNILAPYTVGDDAADAKFNLSRWQAGGIISFSQTCLAEYWHDLPSIVSNNSQNLVAVDPYDFRHRMALEKYLIGHTGGESIWNGNISDVKCSKHPRWGYAAQLDWQCRSGRFEDPTKWCDKDTFDGYYENARLVTNSKISKRSWWGYMNLNFSVACYFGAAEAGLVPVVSLSDDTVTNDVGFQRSVEIWKSFWENDHSTFTNLCSTSKDEEEIEESTYVMYKALWATHTDIVKTGLKYSDSKGLDTILPKEDRGVGFGWCNMVELLSATNWPNLSLDSLCKFGCGYLPSVRLTGPKTLQWLKENRAMEHTTVINLHQLVDTPEKSMEWACSFFGRVARFRFAVNNLPRSLHVLTHGNIVQKILALNRMILLAAFPSFLLDMSIVGRFISKMTTIKKLFSTQIGAMRMKSD